MSTESEDILDRLSKQRQQQAARNDRARLFKSRPEIVEAVKGYKAERAAILAMQAKHGGFMDKARAEARHQGDSELLRNVDQFDAHAGMMHQIDEGLAWLENLQDSDFDYFPYPNSQDQWEIICRRYGHRLGEKCYKSGAALAMQRFYELVDSRLKELERNRIAQGIQPARAPEWRPVFREKEDKGSVVEAEFKS